MKKLESLQAKHRRLLENLKIIKTFKYSGLIGVVIASITKGLISPQLKFENVILVFILGAGIYRFFDKDLKELTEELNIIEGAIENIP